MRARKTKIRGSVVRGRRKNSPHVPNSRMSSLKAKLMSMPSQVTSQVRWSSRMLKAPTLGRMTMRMGLRKAAVARRPLVTGPRYCWQRKASPCSD